MWSQFPMYLPKIQSGLTAGDEFRACASFSEQQISVSGLVRGAVVAQAEGQVCSLAFVISAANETASRIKAVIDIVGVKLLTGL